MNWKSFTFSYNFWFSRQKCKWCERIKRKLSGTNGRPLEATPPPPSILNDRMIERELVVSFSHLHEISISTLDSCLLAPSRTFSDLLIRLQTWNDKKNSLSFYTENFRDFQLRFWLLLLFPRTGCLKV